MSEDNGLRGGAVYYGLLLPEAPVLLAERSRKTSWDKVVLPPQKAYGSTSHIRQNHVLPPESGGY